MAQPVYGNPNANNNRSTGAPQSSGYLEGLLNRIERHPISIFGGAAILAFCCGGLMYLICKTRLFYTRNGLR